MSDFKIGDKVVFKAGRSEICMTGNIVKAAETSGEGRSRKTFVTVKGEDGRERRMMPGALRAA